MRLVCTSDTHGKLPADYIFPPGEVLIHAGDATMMGRLPEIRAFASWMGRQPHAYKLFVPGNHDFAFELGSSDYRAAMQMMDDAGVTVLIDDLANIGGLRFYGSPWTPEFGRWAFTRQRGPQMAEKWRCIPKGVDVLITHGPPFGILDDVPGAGPQGCEDLRERLRIVQPRLHIMGHIHDGHGMERVGETTFLNVAALDGRHRPGEPCVTFDLGPGPLARERTA